MMLVAEAQSWRAQNFWKPGVSKQQRSKLLSAWLWILSWKLTSRLATRTGAGARARAKAKVRVVGTRAGTLRAASSLGQQVFMRRASLNTHSLNSLLQFPVFIGMYENSLYCIESITSPNFPYLLMNLHLTISTAIHAVDDNQAA